MHEDATAHLDRYVAHRRRLSQFAKQKFCRAGMLACGLEVVGLLCVLLHACARWEVVVSAAYT